MSKRLEDFIKTNREEFDAIEPSAGLWDKIESNLPSQFDEVKKREAKTFSLGFVMRVAATIVVVMGIGFAWFLHGSKSVDLAAINPVYAQQQIHYTSMIKSQRSELKTLSKSDPQLYREFTKELSKMDSTYKKLSSDLATSPNQERVLHAMIRNLQVQTEVLNQQLNVIEQFNETKKAQKDESKNI